MFLLSGALALAGQAVEPAVDIRGDCETYVEGKKLTSDELEKRATNWRRQQVVVTVRGSADTPYSCIGRVIFTLQKADVTRLEAVVADAAKPELEQ